MHVAPTSSTDPALDSWARQLAAATLASAFAEPGTALARRGAGYGSTLVLAGWRLLAERAAAAAAGTSLSEPDRVSLVEWLDLPDARRSDAWCRVFGMVAGRRCPPIESEWLPWKDATHRAQHMADAAGFYRAFGLRPDPAQHARADHLAVELDFVALLHEKREILGPGVHDARADVVDRALAAFLGDHLAWWVPQFGRKVERAAAAAGAECAAPDDAADIERIAGSARLLSCWCELESALSGADAALHAPLDPAARAAPDDGLPDACGSCEAAPD